MVPVWMTSLCWEPTPMSSNGSAPTWRSYGILAIIDNRPMGRPVALDVGRVHYNRWVNIGGTGTDIAKVYSETPVRSTLKLGGSAWFVGAGGPMGRMHVQRAIQSADRPGTIVCTDISDDRLADLCTSFSTEAASRGIEFICLNPMNKEVYEAEMARFRKSGFDDIVVLAPVPALIADSATYLAPKGVMNIFAGVARGKYAMVDLSSAYLSQTRIIGHSASTIENMTFMLQQTESGQLSPNRSVAAIGSLEAAWMACKRLRRRHSRGRLSSTHSCNHLPLTGIEDLREVLPGLRQNAQWNGVDQ